MAGVEGGPRFDHVVSVMFENRSYEQARPEVARYDASMGDSELVEPLAPRRDLCRGRHPDREWVEPAQRRRPRGRLTQSRSRLQSGSVMATPIGVPSSTNSIANFNQSTRSPYSSLRMWSCHARFGAWASSAGSGLGLVLCRVGGGCPIMRSSGNLPGVEAICRAGALRSARQLTETVHSVAGGRGGVGVQLR